MKSGPSLIPIHIGFGQTLQPIGGQRVTNHSLNQYIPPINLVDRNFIVKYVGLQNKHTP